MNERTDKRVAQYLRTPFMAILNHSSRVSGADTFTVSTPFHSRCFHHPSSASIHFLYLTSYHLPFTFMSIFLAFSRSANRFNFLLLQLLSLFFFIRFASVASLVTNSLFLPLFTSFCHNLFLLTSKKKLTSR